MSMKEEMYLIDIYDMTYHPWWLQQGFQFLVVVLVGGGLIYAFIAWYLAYQKRRKIPYWQQSIEQIKGLEAQGFDDGQTFYLKLTTIIKEYLQQRFHISVVDKTDAELIDLLNGSTIFPQKIYAEFKDIFEGVTFIKFANQTAAQERMQEACKKSIQLIQDTHLEKE